MAVVEGSLESMVKLLICDRFVFFCPHDTLLDGKD